MRPVRHLNRRRQSPAVAARDAWVRGAYIDDPSQPVEDLTVITAVDQSLDLRGVERLGRATEAPGGRRGIEGKLACCHGVSPARELAPRVPTALEEVRYS